MEGRWPKDDIRRAFVAGAKWWEFHNTGATMWASDRDIAENEATRRYGKANTANDTAATKPGGRPGPGSK